MRNAAVIYISINYCDHFFLLFFFRFINCIKEHDSRYTNIIEQKIIPTMANSGFRMNTRKTKTMIFSNNKKTLAIIAINGEPVEVAKSFNNSVVR